jgi:hypothetical protein
LGSIIHSFDFDQVESVSLLAEIAWWIVAFGQAKRVDSIRVEGRYQPHVGICLEAKRP